MTTATLAKRLDRIEARRGGFDAWFASQLTVTIGGGDPVVHPDKIVITIGGNVPPAVAEAQAAVNGRLIDELRRNWRAGVRP
jgi:hypothetical protein